MPFDLQAAEGDGVPQDQILQHLLAQTPGFDYSAARKDGISDQQIIQHLAAQAQAPQQELTQSPSQATGLGRVAGLAGQAAVKGLSTLAGIPGDIEQIAMQRGVNPLVNALGGTPEDFSQAQSAQNQSTFFPTSGQLVDLASRAGLANSSTLAPTGPLETLGTAAISGAASTLPLAAFGGGVLSPVLAGAGGGAAGEAVHQLMPENSLAPIAASVLGGSIAQGVKSALTGGNLEKEAALLGSSATHQEAGAAVQAHAQNWLDNVFPGKEEAVWAPVDQAMHSPSQPNGPPVSLDNLDKTLKSIVSAGADDPRKGAVAKTMQPALPGKLLDDLLGRTTSPKVDFLRPPGGRPETPPQAALPGGLRSMNPPLPPGGSAPTGGLRPMQSLGTQSITPTDWDFARKIRSFIGNNLKDSKSPTEKDQLDRAYAAITEDLSGAAAKQGVGTIFDAANAESSRLRTLAEQNIGPLASAPSPEQAASKAMSLAQKGGSNLGILRQEMPGAVGELASAHLLQSPKGWTRLSPEAQAQLVPDPAQRDRIGQAVKTYLGKEDQSPLVKAAKKLGDMGTGEIGGVLLNALFPHVDPITAGAIGGAVGRFAPYAESAVKSGFKQPMIPVAAGIGSANALYPNPASP